MTVRATGDQLSRVRGRPATANEGGGDRRSLRTIAMGPLGVAVLVALAAVLVTVWVSFRPYRGC